jgi:anaerobic selenocysteine-containing dehydrogenase
MASPQSGSIRFTTCPLCEATCGLRIEVEGERVLSIRGDREDPFSRGHICPKAVALRDIHEDPDRLRRPLRRVGDEWQEVGWEEALGEVATRMHEIRSEHGRSAFATYLGNPTVHNLGAMLFVPLFLRALESRSIFSATSVDQLPHMVAARLLFGHRLLTPVPDVDRTSFLLILGANPIASNGSMMTVPDVGKRLRAVRERGGRIVVLDPRRTETAAVADEHLFIRPGTDALFLGAVLKELLHDGGIPDHLADLCDGLDRLHEAISWITPETAANFTGVEADAIRRLAADIREAPAAACYGRMGVSTQELGGLCQWLLIVINAITGNLDREGGVMFTRPAFDLIHGPSALTAGRGRFGSRSSRVRGLPDFASELPAAALAEEILEDGDQQIRGLLCFAGNPVLSTPNGRRLDHALESLEFMVSIDPYLNETSRHADYILPPVSPLERSHYDVAFHTLAVRNTAKYSPPVFEPPPDSRHDWQILLGLQDRLARLRGSGRVRRRALLGALHRLGPEGLLALGLRFGPRGAGLNPFSAGLSLRRLSKQPHGIDLGPLEPCLRERMPASHRRIDLAPELFVRDLERLRRSASSIGTDSASGDLALVGRRHVRDNNSWMHNFTRLMGGRSRCTLWMHPDDAAQRDIADGDEVTVTSRVGEVMVAVTLTDNVMSGVVSLPHGYGHGRDGVRLSVAAKHAGVSLNDLTDDQRVDECVGTAAFSGTPVRVARSSG